MNSNYVYDDLVLIAKYATLQQSLEMLSDPVTGLGPSPIDEYMFLCSLNGHRPSPTYYGFLEAAGGEAGTADVIATADKEVIADDAVAGSLREEAAASTTSSGVLHFPANEYIGCVALLSILVTLPACRDLVSIDLSHQQLTSGLVQLLCRSLWHMKRLRSINVSHNQFGADGVKALLRLVLHAPCIRRCAIHGNSSIASLSRRLDDALERNTVRGSFADVASAEDVEVFM